MPVLAMGQSCSTRWSSTFWHFHVLAIQVLAEFLRAKIVVTMCKSTCRSVPALSIALIVIATRVNIREFIFGASARRVLQIDVFWIQILCIWNADDVLAATSIFFWCEESSCRILGTFGALLRQRSHSEVVDGCFPPLYGGLKHAGNDYCYHRHRRT